MIGRNYWGGHLKPNKYRRRNTGAAAGATNGGVKCGLNLNLLTERPPQSFNNNYGVSSPDLSSQDYDHLAPPGLSSVSAIYGSSATLRRSLRSSSTGLNCTAPKAKQVVCPTVPTAGRYASCDRVAIETAID
jgi:hypothetical protein